MSTAAAENSSENYDFLSTLADDLILNCEAFLDYQSLGRMQCLSQRFHQQLETAETIWEERLRQDWIGFPRYRSDRRDYSNEFTTAKDAYKFVFRDVRRTNITEEELVRLKWYFNYTEAAGGRGRDTLLECEFAQDSFLYVGGYPPLPFELAVNGTILRVGSFPDHPIERLGDGEWLICNDAVTFVSCDEQGTLNYNGRNFQ